MKLVITGSNGSTISFQELEVEDADVAGKGVAIEVVAPASQGVVATFSDVFPLDELYKVVNWMKGKPNNWHPQMRGGKEAE